MSDPAGSYYSADARGYRVLVRSVDDFNEFLVALGLGALGGALVLALKDGKKPGA